MKFWNVTYLEEMDYNKQKKPGILPKTAVRSKSKKQQQLREAEDQLPSSSRGNKKELFSGFKGCDVWVFQKKERHEGGQSILPSRC